MPSCPAAPTRLGAPATSGRPLTKRGAMNKLWALSAVAVLSMSSTGCDAIKRAISPRMDKPTIGTRVSSLASLDVKSKVGKAKYLGCDLKYWNMPAGSTISLTWYVFDSEKDQKKGKDRQHTDGKDQSAQQKGVINAYLQALDGKFAPGIYECRWEAHTPGDKRVEGGEQSASIVVGDLDDVKSKSDDDDETPKKKKAKKSSDDDE